MQFAAYCRVSTEEQAKGDNIQIQVRQIRDYCMRNNIDLPPDHFYLDDGISGALRIMERPVGQQLYNAINRGEITNVLTFKIDRLARDNFVAQEILKLMLDAKIAFLSLMEPMVDIYTPEGKLMFNTLSGFASFDRDTIALRFSSGKVTRAASGYLPQGPIPYGYFAERRKPVEIIPEQAETVRLIYRLYIEEDMSQQKISDFLTAIGIPSPAMAKEGWYPRSNGGWCPFSVAKILASEYYATGEYKYKPPGKERLNVPVPTIIDVETFNRARHIAQARKQDCSPPGTYRDYLLRGLIVCGVCGSTYTGTSKNKGQYFYYRCNNKKKTIDCKMPQISADLIEEICWQNIKSWLASSNKLADEVIAVPGQEQGSVTSTEKDLADIKPARFNLEQEKIRLLDGYAKALYSEEDLRAAMADRDYRLQVLTEREKGILETLAAQDEAAGMLHEIGDVEEQIQAIIDNANDEVKRDLFHLLINRVEIHRADDCEEALDIRVLYKFSRESL